MNDNPYEEMEMETNSLMEVMRRAEGELPPDSLTTITEKLTAIEERSVRAIEYLERHQHNVTAQYKACIAAITEAIAKQQCIAKMVAAALKVQENATAHQRGPVEEDADGEV